MLKCDGTTKNCEGCLFRKVPDCRNAMAHHAGALIQLQEVVLDNVGAQSVAQEAEIRTLHAEKKAQNDALHEVNKLLTNVVNGLAEERHCASCTFSKELIDQDAEAHRQLRCKQCKAGENPMYELDHDFGKPADPCEGCGSDTDDCEGCEFNPDNE